VATLIVPRLDDEPWPTLGPQVVAFLQERSIYGPGSLKGEPYVVDPEFRALLYRAYEVYPKWHEWAGRRRFRRVAWSVRKGLAKTEKQGNVVYAELHPEGPVRCDGFDAHGQPVGRPVRDPYIPMLAFTLDQVEELAYNVVKTICEEGPDADLFDASLERVVRLDRFGRADGKAVPLANSPSSRDGARTTLNAFDEPHRLHSPRHRAAHATMDANLPKRILEDPYSLYVGTAGEPGENSVAEDLHREAEQIRDGIITDPKLTYFYRTDNGGHDLTKKADRLKAIAEATGPAGEWGPGQFDDIASQWDRPGADKAYLERVWLNRWRRSERQAFDPKRWDQLCFIGGQRANGLRPVIPRGSSVAVGFDGARFRDATAIVITDLETGTQELWALWERPDDADEDDDWEVPEDEVTDSVRSLMRTHRVVLMFGDPPHWTETYGSWAGKWPDRVVEWWTNRRRPMAYAIREYREAMDSGAVGWSEDHRNAEDLARHIGNAGQEKSQLVDDRGQPLYLLTKIHPERKFDAAMAAVLSWQAYLDAHRKGKFKPGRSRGPRRIDKGGRR